MRLSFIEGMLISMVLLVAAIAIVWPFAGHP
jgi:hypothetical protein